MPDNKPDRVSLIPPSEETTMKSVTLSETEWNEQYEPIHESPLETDAAIIQAIDMHFVWTQTESGSDDPDTAHTGIRLANRVGYRITLKPWRDDEEVVVTLGDTYDNEKQVERLAQAALDDWATPQVMAVCGTCYVALEPWPTDIQMNVISFLLYRLGIADTIEARMQKDDAAKKAN
jgi:hypothetical protein